MPIPYRIRVGREVVNNSMTRRKFEMKRRKGRENSINPIVHVHYIAFDEVSLTTGKRVERV